MEKILVFSLGGVGEIGKNMYVVTVEEDIFVLDAGFAFPKHGMYGIDLVIPDISYLLERQEHVRGIFLTHGHEDHIGAVAYILQQMNVPVYGTAFTLALVEERMSQQGVKKNWLLHQIDKETVLLFDKVKVSFIQMTHSIPGAVGISIHTSQGCIVYTGDFKIDLHPVDRKEIDFPKLTQLEKEGVLCLLSDSTNAEKRGFTPSEKEVGKKINAIFEQTGGRVLVATFSSHIHRIQQVIYAAVQTGRKLAIIGMRMLQTFEIARELGCIRVPEDVIISAADIKKYPKRKVAVLMTGSQGEPLSVLSRAAAKEHNLISIEKGDTIIISAATIPGNEVATSRIVNQLLKIGADAVYSNVHASGHGNQEELKTMISFLKPKYFIPVHGEFRMQKAHGSLAEELQIPKEHIFFIDKGDTIEFLQKEAKRGSKVSAGNILIDGLGIGDVGNIVLRDRKQFAESGVFIVTIFWNKMERKMVKKPVIDTKGFINEKDSTELLQAVLEKVMQLVETITNWSALKEAIRDTLHQFLFEKTKRRPMILPIILEV